jgi:hypothetical protein
LGSESAERVDQVQTGEQCLLEVRPASQRRKEFGTYGRCGVQRNRTNEVVVAVPGLVPLQCSKDLRDGWLLTWASGLSFHVDRIKARGVINVAQKDTGNSGTKRLEKSYR